MGVGSIGVSGFLLILIVALILFGPNKLPELGRAFGKTLREFKNATRGIIGDDDQQVDQSTDRKELNVSRSEDRQPDEKRDNKRLPD